MSYNLIGSALFILASIYTLPFENSLCFSKMCYYDYSLLYLFGTILFLVSTSIELYKNINIPQRNIPKNLILNQIGSVLFVIGSFMFLIDLSKEGVVVFRFGSCVYIVSNVFYDTGPLEIRVFFVSGSALFIIGGLLNNALYKSILWIIGSVFFTTGSALNLLYSF